MTDLEYALEDIREALLKSKHGFSSYKEQKAAMIAAGETK